MDELVPRDVPLIVVLLIGLAIALVRMQIGKSLGVSKDSYEGFQATVSTNVDGLSRRISELSEQLSQRISGAHLRMNSIEKSLDKHEERIDRLSDRLSNLEGRSS